MNYLLIGDQVTRNRLKTGKRANREASIGNRQSAIGNRVALARDCRWSIDNRQSTIGNLNGPMGYTLLELLISITLIAFLMLALLIGLRVSNGAWQKGEARLRQDHAEEEKDTLIVRQISSLLPYVVASTDPKFPGRFTVLEATAGCLRFVGTYSSGFRSGSGLELVEYGIVEASRGNAVLALRETPVRDDRALFGQLVRAVTYDPETGEAVISYQPFVLRATDLPLMTGFSAARFEYLDSHPQDGQGPAWLAQWKSTANKPYPAAIRVRWEQGNQAGEKMVPVRARWLPQ